MKHIVYRQACEADRTSWTAMRVELWPDCPMERHELETRQLLAGDGVVLLAMVDGLEAGFAEISVRHDHVEGAATAPVAYLEGWYVRETFRGRGVGRGLMQAAESWARAKGFTELASDAELENSLSIQLHEKLGFREVGRNVCFIKKL